MLTGYVTYPENYDPEKEKLPMIVFLHGAGEVGNGTPETVEKVRVHGIPKYFVADPDYGNRRVITASPQCIDGYIWDHLTIQLKEWIDEVAEMSGADTSRINITGISMGGFGTWNMLTTFPEYFHRAAPVCGGGVPWRIKERIRGKEIRTFHSIDDEAVPYECTVLQVKRARSFGAYVEFTTYTDKGHGCWDSAYEETDLIDWLCE